MIASMAGRGTTGTGERRAAPAGVPTAAAGHALFVGAIGVALAALLARRWLTGEPAVSVVELWEPGLVLFAPGDEMTSPLGGPPLVVTDAIIRALAAGQIGLFGAFGLLGLGAGLALLTRRAGGRVAATVLFSALLLFGLVNLMALAAAALALGGSATALLPLAAVVGVGLVLWPGFSLWSVRRVGRHLALSASSRDRAWSWVLVAHFGLLAILLGLTSSPGPESGLLLGPWLLTGGVALVVGLTLAGAHALAGLLFARGHPVARRFGAALSGLAAVALGISTAFAPAGVIEQAAGLPGQHRGLRVICALAALLAAGLAAGLARPRGPRVSRP